MAFTVNVNGTPQTVDVDADTPLLWVLRDVLGISGTKFGCGIALCGACTVHVDGVPVRSCVTPVGTVGEKAVTTIEAVGETTIGKALQQAWLELDVVQCGYCQSGQIMSAAALLARTPKPTDDDINQTMSGNVCRCGTYQRVRAAIHLAAKEGGRPMHRSQHTSESSPSALDRRSFIKAGAALAGSLIIDFAIPLGECPAFAQTAP